MKKIVFILVATLVCSPAFAQKRGASRSGNDVNLNMNDSGAWIPRTFTKLTLQEQSIIKNLTRVNESNKIFVQLLLESGMYKNCGVGTSLRHDRIYISLFDKNTSKRYSYLLKIDQALVNEHQFMLDDGTPLYVLVFDQVVKGPNGNQPETIFMYFLMSSTGGVEILNIDNKKSVGSTLPLISNFLGKVEQGYQLECLGR